MHFCFKIPINCIPNSICNTKRQSHLTYLLRQILLTILDKIPILYKENFTAVNLKLKDICNDEDYLFRRILAILEGKFA